MVHGEKTPSGYNLGISLSKPHILVRGELSWWTQAHANYIRTQDYECWFIIENGDNKIDENLAKDKYTSIQFGQLEKNTKARQLILNGLSREDMDKVMSIPTAKEMWEAIQVLHRGSKDDQNALQFELNREFHSFSMKSGEAVGSYHSRFQTLCDKMKASGIDMDKVNVALPFIHGVDSRFTTTKRVMLMTREAQSLSLLELAGKFAM